MAAVCGNGSASQEGRRFSGEGRVGPGNDGWSAVGWAVSAQGCPSHHGQPNGHGDPKKTEPRWGNAFPIPRSTAWPSGSRRLALTSLAAALLVLLAAAAGADVVAADAGDGAYGLGLGQHFVGFGDHVAGFSQ
jgi:hypothetical protein